ncbi:MAG: glycosyltransferase [Candidatus Omnitrophota bacterium]
METGKVSIILPTYNGEKYIREAIDSCLNQTYDDLELIVVEDGSDRVHDIVTSYSDKRIRYLRHEENKGISAALNTGFAESSGEFLTWTSDDNIYMPGAIERMVEALAPGNADFVYADFAEIDGEGNLMRQVKVLPPESLKKVNYIGLCFLYTRRIYERLGGYDPEAFLAEDYEYWLRIYYSGYRMKNLRECLYYVRMHPGCLTMRYDRDEIERRAQMARDKYIPAALKYYQHGAIEYYKKKDHAAAKKNLIRSIMLNPFNYQAIRLLAILYLADSVVRAIRKRKRLWQDR